MRFQVGDYIDPGLGDAWYESEQEALAVARELNKPDENVAIAVWDSHSDVCWLVLRGVTFRPE